MHLTPELRNGAVTYSPEGEGHKVAWIEVTRGIQIGVLGSGTAAVTALVLGISEYKWSDGTIRLPDQNQCGGFTDPIANSQCNGV